MLLRFLRRPRREQALLLRAWAWLLAYAIGVRVHRGRWAADALRQEAALPKQGQASPAVQEIAWAVSAAAVHLPGATCLVQSLAGRRLFQHYGYATRLKVGVRHEHAFEAHAWLELDDGEVLLPSAQATGGFAALPLGRATHR